MDRSSQGSLVIYRRLLSLSLFLFSLRAPFTAAPSAAQPRPRKAPKDSRFSRFSENSMFSIGFCCISSQSGFGILQKPKAGALFSCWAWRHGSRPEKSDGQAVLGPRYCCLCSRSYSHSSAACVNGNLPQTLHRCLNECESPTHIPPLYV